MSSGPVRFATGAIGDACRELERRIGTLFHAVDGPARAFFELGHGPLPKDHLRVIYVTWAYGCISALPATEMERQLCERMFADLSELVESEEDASEMLLFWRKRPQVFVELGPTEGLLEVAVRMRFSVPNLDLKKARGYKMEGETIEHIRVVGPGNV